MKNRWIIYVVNLVFVNASLNKVYDIIFKRGLDYDNVIKKIVSIKDRDNNHFIDKDSAIQIYEKFKKIKLPPNIGGSGTGNNPPSILKKSEGDRNVLGKISQMNNISSKHKSRLNQKERRLLDKSFDMMEILLITLSLLPVAGWTFDFPLLLYSLTQRKYTLAMITVLNWYIWAFWLLFGVNVNMGPTMKTSYLGNSENIVKKALLYPSEPPSKVINPFTKAKVKYINNEPFLIDDNGNVFSAEIKSPSTLGLIINKDGKETFIDRHDPEYEKELKKKKKDLKKDKIGPTNLL